MYSNSPSQVITCFNMRDRLERFVLLPFNAGCISESSIPVVVQHTKRSKFYTDSTPTRKRDEEKDEEEDYLSGEILKTALPRLQKIGLDGCATSFFSERSWENISAPELIDLHSFPMKQQLELAMSAQDETPNVKCSFHDDNMMQQKIVES